MLQTAFSQIGTGQFTAFQLDAIHKSLLEFQIGKIAVVKQRVRNFTGRHLSPGKNNIFEDDMPDIDVACFLGVDDTVLNQAVADKILLAKQINLGLWQ